MNRINDYQAGPFLLLDCDLEWQCNIKYARQSVSGSAARLLQDVTNSFSRSTISLSISFRMTMGRRPTPILDGDLAIGHKSELSAGKYCHIF